MSGIGGEPEPEPEPVPEVVVERRGRGRRYEIIEDPDRLCEELQREEKLVEKEKKKLKVLVNRAPQVEGRLYQQVQARIEKLEAKIDDRLERIALLATQIQCAMDEMDEDEEEMLLLS